MSYFKTTLIIFSICSLLVTPCFATAAPIDDQGDVATDYMTCMEPQLEIEADEMATVNISDESIEAIADAVSSRATTTTFTCDYAITYGATTYYIPSCLIDTYNIIVMPDAASHKFFAIPNYYGQNYIYYDESQYWSMRYSITYYDEYDATSTKGIIYGTNLTTTKDAVVSFKTNDSIAGGSIATSYIADPVAWSNYNVLNADGNLVHSADYKQASTVYFISGFDDLSIPSQATTSFNLPTPVYDGYIFLGWYLDPAFENQYTSSYEFTMDTILYAKWISQEEVPMIEFHTTIFDSIKALFNCEPMLYILSLTGLVCIIGIARVFVKTRF